MRIRCNEALARLSDIRVQQQQQGSIVRGQMKSMLKAGKKRTSLKAMWKEPKKKKCAWKYKFVCLAYVDQKKVPTTEAEKDELYEAGLGEKDVEFESLDTSTEEFKAVLVNAFPQLSEAGKLIYLLT